MRPIQLELSDFGPFVGVHRLDFSRLDDFFLVSGPTGSGKTTLFDAISWALYSRPNGKRSSADIVSHFSSGENTRVSFEFAIGNERYLIERRPAREASKLRGSGTTTRSHEVMLQKHSEKSGWQVLANKVNEVDDLVVKIIGLSMDEFSTILLLPQGQFQNFLEMETGKKAEILEKLFPVEMHGLITLEARNTLNESRQRISVLDSRISTLREESENLPELEAEAQKAKTAEEEARVKQEEARRNYELNIKLASDWAIHDKTRSDLDELLEHEPAIRLIEARLDGAGLAAGIRAEMEAWHSAQKAWEALEDQIGKLKAEEGELLARQDAMQELKATVEKIDEMKTAMLQKKSILLGRQEAWERYRNAYAEFEEGEKSFVLSQGEQLKSSQRLEEEKEKLGELLALSRDPAGLAEMRETALALLQKEETRLKTLGQIKSIWDELEQAEKRLYICRAEYEREEARRSTARKKADRLDEEGQKRLIQKLGAGLKKGEPCPVCGSEDHPSPSSQHLELELDYNPDEVKAELEGAMAAFEKALGEMSSAESLTASLKARMQKELAGWLELNPEAEHLLNPDEAKVFSEKLVAFHVSIKESLGIARSRVEDARAAEKSEQKRQEAERASRSIIESEESRHRTVTENYNMARNSLAALNAKKEEASLAAGGEDPGPQVLAIQKEEQTLEEKKRNALLELESWEKGLARTRTALAVQEEHSGKASVQRKSCQKKGMEALAKAGFDNADEWQEACMDEREMVAARDEAVRFRERSRALDAELAFQARALENTERPEIKKLEELMEDAGSHYKILRDASVRAQAALAKAVDAGQKLESLEAERKLLEEKQRRLASIFSMLNGETKGKKVSFKNWALASYFESVVAMASIRLREMTLGRYDLFRSEGQARGRGGVGLDLEVQDAFTGRARPAHTLSGGEKFQCALALALGLSDVIISRAGGLVLESIFIDEGFGSLDPETLDRAIIALDSVRGNRTIGIISHVEELKMRIPSRIDIIKTRTGSSLRTAY